KNPRIVRIFVDYTGSRELKSVLIRVIRGLHGVILKGNNYILTLNTGTVYYTYLSAAGRNKI
ncbi:MAG: hypothetical protein LBD55_07450, partial [Treponema sp.]|nr:hypothetical protein [Treponema sp.]